MLSTIKSKLSHLLGQTPIARWPVTVRGGIAAGARWTLLPYSAYWRGLGERDVEQAIQFLGDLKGACCWDLGAHFGIYTVGLARLTGPEGQVVSFEPDPFSNARCALHLRMNQLNHVKLFRAAVGAEPGRQRFIVNGGLGATGNHLTYEGESVNSKTPCIEIETIRLDDLVAQGVIRAPKFIKVDVEGHGAKALAGAITTITRHRPALITSFHSTAEFEGIKALLTPLGYSCHKPGGQPVDWAEGSRLNALLLPN